MAMTAAEELALVELQISRVLQGGQDVQLPNGTRVTLPSLDELNARRQRLLAEISPETSGQAPVFVPVALGRVPG